MNGTYSLADPSENKKIQCKNCYYLKAQSCQLDQIILKQNYWRQDNHSDIIYQCDADSKACKGDESKGCCAQGYIGALCQACDNYGILWGENYGQVNSINKQSIECMKCSELGKNSFKQIIALLVIYFMISKALLGCKFTKVPRKYNLIHSTQISNHTNYLNDLLYICVLFF
ncbi:hypothetical protein ABPG72_011092 [Tetrahymena utriculariae]